MVCAETTSAIGSSPPVSGTNPAEASRTTNHVAEVRVVSHDQHGTPVQLFHYTTLRWRPPSCSVAR